MKKEVILSALVLIFLMNLVSAEIVINQQPKEFYNMGDVIEIPIKVVTATEINGFFSMHLICNGIESEVHKEYVRLQAGEEKGITPSIPLVSSMVGRTTGTCKLKAMLGGENILTNEFEISDLINIKILSEKREFIPESDIIIEGEALKKNGEPVKGVIELKILGDNATQKEILESVKNGYFFLNFSMPKETKAGQYLADLNIYEKDFEGNISNRGFANLNIKISQVPTSLEIVFENQTIVPGSNLRVKSVLHDQTGEKISALSIITIKDNKDLIREQTEKQTDEFLELPVSYNEPPAKWKVVAVSERFSVESIFEVLEKEAINIELANKTIIVTNMGNVPYNKTILVRVGNESKYLDVSLAVDEDKKYMLSAPDGEYAVEIVSKEGDKITGTVALTGRAIDVKEAREGGLRAYAILAFVVLLVGIFAVLIFRKNNRGKISFPGFLKKKSEPSQLNPLSFIRGSDSLIETKEKAQLSLSIKGEQQEANIACLKIKNFEEVRQKKGGVDEIFQKIAQEAERNKAVIYENQNFVFFIFAPLKTKTFDNEKAALDTAKSISNILAEHNKMFSQKIDFGLSLSYGTIIAKQEDVFKFVSMGALLTAAKKIASLSNGEILINDKMNSRIMKYAKTERKRSEDIPVYGIKEVKDSDQNQNFIKSFLKRNQW